MPEKNFYAKGSFFTMSSTSLFSQYFSSSMISGSAKVIKILAGIAVVAFLNLIAGKEEFGLFMIAYSIAFMIAISIETFFQNLILYHSGREDDGKDINDIPILAASLYWGTAIAALAGIILYFCSSLIESIMGHEGLAFWIMLMAPFIPSHTLLTLLSSAYRARHKVITMAIYFDIYPSLLLVFFTSLIWLMGINAYAIGLAHSLAFILPFCILFSQKPMTLPKHWVGFTRWDIGYGFKSMAVYIANQPGLGLDVLFVGQFCDVGTTAEYAMASRFAQILMLPKMAISQLQVPRMGRFLRDKNITGLKQEFESLQDISLLTTVLGCLIYVLLALPVMNLFGEYSSAYEILLILCAASLIKAGFGASGGYLGMAGYAGWLFLTNIFAVAVLFLAMFTLVPTLEGIGAGYALAIHALATMASMSAVIYYCDKINLMRLSTMIFLASVIAILSLAGHQIIGISSTSSLLIIMSLIYIYMERQSIRFLLPPRKGIIT